MIGLITKDKIHQREQWFAWWELVLMDALVEQRRVRKEQP